MLAKLNFFTLRKGKPLPFLFFAMKSSLNQTKKDAEKNYRKLSDPLLSLVNYTQGWLAEIRDQDINLHKLQQKNTHPHKVRGLGSL